MRSVKCSECGLVNWATEASCKRCAAALGNSADAPAAYSAQRGVSEQTEGPGEVVQTCSRCGGQVAVKRWDAMNNFSIDCPRCDGLHGQRWSRWSLRQVVFASFLFNAFSFLFTMRPRNGVLTLAGFAAAGVAGYFFLDSLPDIYQIAFVSAFVLAPMVINGVIILKHNADFDTPDARRQSAGA